MEFSKKHKLNFAVGLCSNDVPIDRFTKFITNSHLSHMFIIVIGKIVQKKNVKSIDFSGNDVLVVHYPGVRIASGIEVVEYSKWSNKYPGSFFIRSIHDLIKLNGKAIKNTQDFINQTIKKDILYEKRFTDFVSTVNGPRGNYNTDKGTFICSEFVAECYKHLRVLPSFIASNSYLPKHFNDEDNDDYKIIQEFKKKAMQIKIPNSLKPSRLKWRRWKSCILTPPFVFKTVIRKKVNKK